MLPARTPSPLSFKSTSASWWPWLLATHNLANSDTRRLDNEKVFIMRKIDEVQHEIFQLENNIQFFANAKADNPMVKEVVKNIERQKEELATWKEKLKQLRNLKTE
jgi:hypothetical protein